MNLADKNILIVGLGTSGIATARFAVNRGASVTATDISPADDIADHVQEALAMGVELELGRHETETFERADLIVISPGVLHTIPQILRARSKNVPILGEIELASRFIREPVIAVSGTNGKTTTTTLLGEMIKNSGLKAFVGGNIGNPLIDYVDQKVKADIVVAEISSFQLDTIETFRPKVSVLLNITEDHMDRYPDFEAYIRSKCRIFENQQADDIAVINGSDSLLRSVTQNIKARKLAFYHYRDNDAQTLDRATINWNGTSNSAFIGLQLQGIPTASIELGEYKLAGRHNLENAAAASLAALAAGADIKAVQSTLNTFKGLAHRLELIATISGVRFINDSKATNVDAVARALEAFSSPVVLIMGGRDKGGNFKALKELVHKHTKKLIVMGEAKEKVKSALDDVLPQAPQTADGMEDAVLLAFQAADPGDVVLLAPGCASFDMYSSYAQRGKDFSQAVKKMQATAAARPIEAADNRTASQ